VSGREQIEAELRVTPGDQADLANRSSIWTGTGNFAALAASEVNRHQAAREVLARGRADLVTTQALMRTEGTSALLIVFEGLDREGTYSTIEHLTLGLDRHGTQVRSLGWPSSDELAHTFLWRALRVAPRRGTIAILDGSFYADVVAARVHPDWLGQRTQPPTDPGSDYWAERFDDINAFERHLSRNGTKVVKCFLNVSSQDQRSRLLDPLDGPAESRNGGSAEIAERPEQNDLIQAYEDAITATSTDWAPWYVIPADDEAVAEAFAVSVIVDASRAVDLERTASSDAN
jgi:polyphosphate kinase 2 (PPK2 family)